MQITGKGFVVVVSNQFAYLHYGFVSEILQN